MTGLLDGIRVIDLSQGVAGPVVGLMLAELGADVFKVEPPAGDVTRGHLGFATWNRSRRGVVLALDDHGDVERLHPLVKSADVLLHDLVPSTTQRLNDSTARARA